MTVSNDGALHQTLVNFLQKHNISNKDSIAIAVSGGPDSMALAHMLCSVHSGGVHILCVDHGLRKNVGDEIQKLKDWVVSSNHSNLSFHVLKWEGKKPDNAIMEAARFARYDLLNEYCAQYDISSLFVGHHQDDQAETFLMRLVNGSGIDGLAAMHAEQAYRDIKIFRPLLAHAKQELIDYCHSNHLPYTEDPSNENADYLRPRLRQSMDILATEGLSSKRLANTAKRLSRARKALETVTLKAVDETLCEKSSNKVSIDFNLLMKQPEEIGFRVLKHYIEFFRPDETYHVRMEKLEDLFEGLWGGSNDFKPRTLGRCKISLSKNKEILIIEKE